MNKTKIVVFSKRKVKNCREIKIFNSAIEIQDSYTYLGIVFNYTGNFTQAKKKLVDQANNALQSWSL